MTAAARDLDASRQARRPIYPWKPATRPDMRPDELLQEANRLYHEGRMSEALALCGQILSQNDENADALNLTGIIHSDQGRHAKAAAYFKRALAICPDEAIFHYNLARALAKEGRPDEAREHRQRAQALERDPSLAFAEAADALKKQGRLARAVSLYRKALALRPDDMELHHRLGLTLHECGRLDEAEDAFRKALSFDPHNPVVLNNLGNTLQFLGRLDEAARCYRRAMESDPRHAMACSNLGFVELSQGNRKAAIAHFRQALALDPRLTEAHLHLARAIRHTAHDEDMRKMETLAQTAGLSDEQKMHLHFALGKSYDDLAQYDQAFEHYLRANRLKRNSIRYRESYTLASIRKIMDTFDEALFRKYRNSGHHDDTPIFIVGMPRSGSTLTEQILACHPDVVGAGELPDLGHLLQREALENAAQGAGFPDYVAGFQERDFRRLGAEYLRLIRKRAPNARHITDKMPHNFLFIGMIRLILPQARIIHCRRDPVDTCLSIFKQYFGGSHLYAYDLVELGNFYRQYEDLMRHWQRVLPGHVLDFDYEDLVADQEAQTRRLLDFCGLPWNDACLSFHESERAVWTSSVSQVRRPLYKDSIQRWRHYRRHLGPLLDALGRKTAE
ncbi:MAG TPA: tetratricopeptide repeat protein [Gammaproteobacteria bacterium]|nr:tetratricopeptide repeat protein [Gammaproteobacteria bacterium]